MKKNSTNLILAISILLLLGLIALFAFSLQVIKNKNKHISAVTATLQEKITEKENIKALEKRISELGDTQKKMNSYLVDTSNIDTFVEFLENIGINNGVDLTVKGVEVPKSEKNKLSININMDGSFSNITKLIAILENSPYVLVVNSMYLNKDINGSPASVVVNTTDKKNAQPVSVKSSWQANVTFTVLSS